MFTIAIGKAIRAASDLSRALEPFKQSHFDERTISHMEKGSNQHCGELGREEKENNMGKPTHLINKNIPTRCRVGQHHETWWIRP